MGFSRPCGLLSWCVGSWPFTDATLHVLRRAWAALADSQTFTCARSPSSRTGDFEDLTTTRIGWEVSFSIQRRPWSFLPPLPCDCLSQLRRAPDSSWFPFGFHANSVVIDVASSSGLSKDRLSIGPPCRSPLPAPFGTFEAGVATALSRDPPSFRPRRFHDLAGLLLLQATGLAPGPDPGVRRVSLKLGSRLALVPRRAFLPFEAFLPAARCDLRSRDDRGGSSPPRRCRREVHRTPSLLVLRSFRFREPRGNLEGFLVLRSRTPVRRFQRRSALAPLGLSIL